MLPSKNSSWFLWAVKGTKKKNKKGKRETLQMLYFRRTFKNYFRKNKDKGNRKNTWGILELGVTFHLPMQHPVNCQTSPRPASH